MRPCWGSVLLRAQVPGDLNMAAPKAFSGFDISGTTLTLWILRKYGTPGSPPRYTAHWVDTNADLDNALKGAIASSRDDVTELSDYSLLVQINELSALIIDADETHAGLIIDAVGEETNSRKIQNAEELQNSGLYVAKLAKGNKVLYAVKKTETSWQTRRRKDAIYAFFNNHKLALDEKPSFQISRNVNFFIADGQVIILNKLSFESILNYKQAHIEDFGALQKEPAFSGLFNTLDPLVEFVGSNKIRLRRVSAIRSKGHYKNQYFMSQLKKRHARYQLHLEFDAQGRIVPTEETCADIIRALLDHRLLSPFSDQLYDVPDAVAVS